MSVPALGDAVDAVARARMEAGYAMAALRPFIHDPQIQGLIQELQFFIDDAAKFLAEHSTREKSNERKQLQQTTGAATPAK